MRLQRGAVPLLILALQDPKTWPAKSSGLQAQSPVLAAQKILAQQARPGDLVLLVAVSDMDTAQDWAAKLPQVSAVFVAQRSMMSFFPREFVRPQDKGKIDGSSLPLMSAGHSGGQLVQLDIFYQPGDTTLRGGAVFEDAREQLAEANKILRKQPKNPGALGQREQAQKTLNRQKGLSHYRYRYVEMDLKKPEDAAVKSLFLRAKHGSK